jgi:hypothetical protein
MKTKEEIEQLAEKMFDDIDKPTRSGKDKHSYLVGVQEGYTQCQEDMADEMVNFHEWIRLSKPSELKYVGNVNGKCYYYKGEYYTTKELYIIYNSLNKQD